MEVGKRELKEESKKAFICAHANFPRCGAESNYIEYLALALIQTGYKVYIIARGKNNPQDWIQEEKCYCYNGIYYDNVDGRYTTTKEYAEEYFLEGNKVIKLLEKFQAMQGDLLFFYTINYFYIRTIFKYIRTKEMKAAACVVEWHQPFQYKCGIFNPLYWMENIGFTYGIPMCKKVFPISGYLAEYFERKGCKTMCLPIMANIRDFNLTHKVDTDKINFIYSGNPFYKDAIDVIIQSFCALPDEKLQKLHIHFTGMNKKTVELLRLKYKEQLEILKDSLTIYEWLSYEELLILYRKIDFLILLRRTNKVTLSNFPSKVPEMMTYGIIPIVSEVGDYTKTYLRDNIDSIVVKRCTVSDGKEALVRALKMTKEQKRKMQEEAFHTLSEKFDYRKWADEIVKFME